MMIALSSCKFYCSVGKNSDDKNESNKPIIKEGTALYNGIDLYTNKIHVEKAYLVYDNGERIPEDNFVDFTNNIKLILIIRDGWKIVDGKVKLGASKKVKDENGNLILDENDLFSENETITAEDAKIIGLTLSIRVQQNNSPASFVTSFRVWDKNGEGYIEGVYKLNSK